MTDKTVFKDFTELQQPQLGAVNDKWVIFSIDDMFIVLLKSFELGYGPERDTSEFEFDTALEAYFGALRYYANNDKAFPYLDELLEVLDNE